jgi:hypothetical protein
LIDSGKKLGYMALIRNLRNILEAEVSQEHIIKVCERISDEAEVKNSKLLPFRFLSAYREIEGNKSMFTVMLLDSLELAAGYSADSLEGFNYDTRIVIASDVSGSMHHQISEKSSVMYVDIGLLMSMALRQKCKSVITGVFGDTWLVENFPKGNILKNTMKLRHPEGRVGYSTNGYLVIDDLIKRKIISDKVFIFTDGQMWDSLYGDEDFSKYWSKYKKICPEAKLYLFDLAGYGKTPISILRNDVFLIAGWSDEIFKVLQAIEDGSSALKEIKKIEI